MVTYVVRLDWPAQRTPDLDAELLLKHLADQAPVVAAGRIVEDGDPTPWTVTVCSEGRTPRMAALNALAVVEPLIGVRVTGFRVEDSDQCEQLADVRDSVPDLVPDAEVRRLVADHPLSFDELVTQPDFPQIVVETRHGALRDLDEVREWLTSQGTAPA